MILIWKPILIKKLPLLMEPASFFVASFSFMMHKPAEAGKTNTRLLIRKENRNKLCIKD
jgi:hypothetical protein